MARKRNRLGHREELSRLLRILTRKRTRERLFNEISNPTPNLRSPSSWAPTCESVRQSIARIAPCCCCRLCSRRRTVPRPSKSRALQDRRRPRRRPRFLRHRPPRRGRRGRPPRTASVSSWRTAAAPAAVAAGGARGSRRAGRPSGAAGAGSADGAPVVWVGTLKQGAGGGSPSCLT